MTADSALIFAQLFLGLMNGAFYALLSLGLALIFGLLGITNFAHGAFFMLGAYFAWLFADLWGLSYWLALPLVPIFVGGLGLVFEKFLIRPLYKRDAEYSLLLTFGLALIIEGTLTKIHGTSGLPYEAPELLQDALLLGDIALPYYRMWVLVVSIVSCLAIYYCVERTSLGARLRAIRENAKLCQALGVNTKKYLSFSFAAATALAAFAGVMAAPVFQVRPTMGADFIIVVFAVVVVGGMNSLRGAIVAGFVLGALEGVARIFIPETSQMIIYIAMAIFLLVAPVQAQTKESAV